MLRDYITPRHCFHIIRVWRNALRSPGASNAEEVSLVAVKSNAAFHHSRIHDSSFAETSTVMSHQQCFGNAIPSKTNKNDRCLLSGWTRPAARQEKHKQQNVIFNAVVAGMPGYGRAPKVTPNTEVLEMIEVPLRCISSRASKAVYSGGSKSI